VAVYGGIAVNNFIKPEIKKKLLYLNASRDFNNTREAHDIEVPITKLM
jgi:hypothetical protein